jgi:hypothetical protein
MPRDMLILDNSQISAVAEKVYRNKFWKKSYAWNETTAIAYNDMECKGLVTVEK